MSSSGDASQPACWWCGRLADSREHKFKRRDLDVAFGSGSWHGRVAAHRRPAEETFSYPNSSRSNSLKFKTVLCRDCNSRRSQPLDRAYDQFADFVRQRGPDLYLSKRLDWREVFPNRWEEGRDNVTRYWVKHIACRLAELSIPIAAPLIDFMDGRGPLLHLEMWLEIREDFVIAQRESVEAHGEPMRGLWIGDLLGWADRRTGRFDTAEGHWGLDALFLVYRYSVDQRMARTNFNECVNELPTVWSSA